MSRLLSLIVAVVLGVTAPASVRAAAPAKDDAPAKRDEPVVRAELELDVTALGDDGELLLPQLRIRGDALLRNREVLPARTADDPRLVVAIEPLGDGGPGYRCRWTVYRGEAAIGGTEGTSLCKLCTENELVDHVEAAIERAVPQIPAQAAVTTDTPVVPPPEAKPGKLGALGKAGIGVGAVGLASLVTGIALAAIEPPVRNATEVSREILPTRPAGIALVGAGVAAAIVGLTMLAVDRHRARKRAGTTAVVPAELAGGAAVVLRGRF